MMASLRCVILCSTQCVPKNKNITCAGMQKTWQTRLCSCAVLVCEFVQLVQFFNDLVPDVLIHWIFKILYQPYQDGFAVGCDEH